jgi:hypothetical protein
MSCSASSEPDYAADVARLRETDASLAEEVAGFTGISSVLAWMRTRGLAQAAVDMVGMDEFEYDFLIQLQPAGRWIVFGVT